MRDCPNFLVQVLTSLMLAGCIEQAYQDGTGLAPTVTEPATSGGNSPTTTGALPTTSEGVDATPVASVTGSTEETMSSSTDPGPAMTTTGDPGENLPPKIELFEVTDVVGSPIDHISEAGSALLQLKVSADAVKVRLYLDGVLLEELAPADFPYTWEALSAKNNGPKRIFKVVALDAEELTDEATAQLGVQLPASGAPKCLFEDPDKGSLASEISAVKYTSKAIIAVGKKDVGAGWRLTVWLLDPDHCEVILPGWPKTIASWSGGDEFDKLTSVGTAVDLDEDGNIVVGGNFLVDGKTQSYVALLNAAGSLLWEQAGQVGGEVTSVAAARAQFKNRVFVGGVQHTSDNPVRTDGAIWVYVATDDKVFVGPPVILAAPFTPDELSDPKNARSEWVRAIVIHPGTGYAMGVGEREFSPDGLKVYSRTFTVQVHPLGFLVATPWTSKAETGLLHDAARSVGACGDGFLAGGWTRDVPANAKPQPMIFWLGTDGSATQHRPEPQLASTQIHGIACDREGKIVSAGTRTTVSADAQVFTITGLFDAPSWYETGDSSDDGAGAVACDERGFCGWGGYRTANGKPYAVVRVHNP